MTADGTVDYGEGMARLIIGSVVIPFLFVIVMSGVEYLAKPRLLWDLMTDVGWDMCILGIGVTGGIFSARLAANSCMTLGLFAVALPSVLTLWR